MIPALSFETLLASLAPACRSAWSGLRAHLQVVSAQRTRVPRHAFASRMIARGISSTVLAALMGHESSAITERRYIHLFDKHRTDEAVRQAMASAS
jgi:integrase